MKRILSTIVVVGLLGGCDAAEYYPNHETPMRQADLSKGGPDTYGGNNSNYPVGTPGTAVQPPTAPRPLTTTVPAQAGPTLNTNGTGTFPNPGSSAGSSVGGGNAAAAQGIPPDGTTTIGAGR